MTPLAALNAAYTLLPAAMNSRWATINALAIQRQEDPQQTRAQVLIGTDGKRLKGPARGLWQFEKGGGVRGVLLHRATAKLAMEVCDALGVDPTPDAVWSALETDDVLAAAFARLLIYTDPFPLPTTQAAAWTMYADRLWRPGKPHPEKWQANWTAAQMMV